MPNLARNLDADITKESHSATPQRTDAARGAAAQRATSSRQTKTDLGAYLIEAIRLEVGSATSSCRSTTERSPVRIPASASRSDYSLESQAGSKAILDASAVHLMINSLNSWHAQYETFFELIIQEVSEEGQPRTWLPDLDPLVSMPIAEASKVQIALLYVVRAWLTSTPGDMAKELSRQLSQKQLDYTVAKFFRTSRTNAQRVQSTECLGIATNVQATEHLDIATRIVHFGSVALLLKVTELLP